MRDRESHQSFPGVSQNMDISPRSRVCRWIWEVLFRPWRWRSPQTNASVDPEAPGVDPDVDIEECLAAGHPDQDPQPDQEDPQPDQDAEYADNGDDEDWAVSHCLLGSYFRRNTHS